MPPICTYFLLNAFHAEQDECTSSPSKGHASIEIYQLTLYNQKIDSFQIEFNMYH